MRVTIAAAVEGVTDEAAVRRLIEHAGAEPGVVYGKAGKPHPRERISGYNLAARHAPWVVIERLARGGRGQAGQQLTE
jgi:hypothetical protein